jgi:hypothetical protein
MSGPFVSHRSHPFGWDSARHCVHTTPKGGGSTDCSVAGPQPGSPGSLAFDKENWQTSIKKYWKTLCRACFRPISLSERWKTISDQSLCQNSIEYRFPATSFAAELVSTRTKWLMSRWAGGADAEPSATSAGRPSCRYSSETRVHAVYIIFCCVRVHRTLFLRSAVSLTRAVAQRRTWSENSIFLAASRVRARSLAYNQCIYYMFAVLQRLSL